MSAMIAPKLARYKKIILSLVPHAEHPRLSHVVKQACERYFPGVLESVHFEIKLEVQRLATPCMRKIDLRIYFDDCEEYEHNKVVHHLDDVAKIVFVDGVLNNNGILNAVLYNNIVDTSKLRFRNTQEEERILLEKQRSREGLPPQPIFEQSLQNNLLCSSSRIKHSSKSTVSLYAPSSMSDDEINEHLFYSEILACTANGVRFHVAKEDYANLGAHFFLDLYSHDKEIENIMGAKKHIVVQMRFIRTIPVSNDKCVMVECAPSNKNMESALLAFNGYCAARWQANTINANEQQEPLKSSILAKAHQQFYNTSTDSITLLIAKFSSGYRPAVGLKNKRNSELWRFFDKESKCELSHIFNTPEMQRACEGSNNDGYFLGVTYNDGKYYCEWDRALLASELWAEITRKKTGFVFHISFESINASQLAHVKSALPDYMGHEFAILNRPAPKKVSELLDVTRRKVTLTPLNGLLENFIDTRNVKLGAYFETAQPIEYWNKRDPLQIIDVDQDEFRQEDRFNCTLEATVSYKNRAHKAITENISPNGLKIIFNSPVKIDVGTTMLLDLSLPSGKKSQLLSKQPYQVIANIDNQTYRLLFCGSDSNRHVADKSLRQFIYKNIDVLTVNNQGDPFLNSLKQSVQNIATHNHHEMPVFIEQGKHHRYARGAATNNRNLNIPSEGSEIEKLNSLFSQKAFLNEVLKEINQLNNSHDGTVLYWAVSNNDDSSNGLWFRNLKGTKHNIPLKNALSKLHKKGGLRVLRLNINKTGRLTSKHFKDEIDRLQRINQFMHRDVLNTLDNTSGVVTMQDATEFALNCWLGVKEETSAAA
jgi:cupin superfamily acireductone dioxygenase involved in methionine salvage